MFNICDDEASEIVGFRQSENQIEQVANAKEREMPSTKAYIRVTLDVQFHLSGAPDDEREVAHPVVDIVYLYKPGSPAVMYQRNGDPGWPAEPAELYLVGASLVDGDGLAPRQEQVDEWAQDWLDDEGFQRACEHAEDMRYPDPDDERDRRRDDALTGD